MSNLAEAKDWIYVFCTIIQTVLAIVALVLANWYWRRKERREEEERSEKERREKKERSEKEDREKEKRLDREIREKISKVFSERYYTIENEIEMMSKTLERLKTTPIIRRGRRLFTSLDVLMYMCEASQRNTFQTPALKSFCKALDKIARFFQCFRVELPPTDGKCPKNIKEEMGQIIADVGNHIFPFVSTARQKTIKWVLEYFEKNLTDENVTNLLDTNRRGTNPQDTNLQDTIPYIKLLRFGQSSTGGSQISFDKAEIGFIGRAQDQIINDIAKKCPNNSNVIINLLKDFMQRRDFLEQGNEEVENQNDQPAYLLHLIRLLIYELSEDQTLWNDVAYKALRGHLTALVYPKITDKDLHKMNCTRYLQDIERYSHDCQEKRFEALLEKQTTYELLKKQNEELQSIMAEFIRNPEAVPKCGAYQSCSSVHLICVHV